MAVYLPYMAAALLLSLVLTRWAIFLLPRLGMVDVPHGRHQHEHPVPRGGGIAVWLSFFAVSVFMLLVTKKYNAAFHGEFVRLLEHISLPAFLILLLGIIDDKRGLRSVTKLVCQILIAVLIYFSGSGISHLLGFPLPVYVGLPLTVIWAILIINAFNLVDGLDGIAAGLGAIASFLLAVWMLVSGGARPMTAVLLIFCGACLGFLKYNFSPARIFLGDAGSLFIGLFFAQVSMYSSEKAATFTALLVPLMALGIPLFDVFLAVWRRFFRRYVLKDTNANIMQGDHDHLHHRIQNQTGQQRRTAFGIYIVSALLSVMTMFSVFMDKRLPALLFLLLLITIFTCIRYAYIEIYDTISSVSEGIRTPHRNFLFTALHPVIDAMLVVAAFWITHWCLAALRPPRQVDGWVLIFAVPFTLCLCFSGIYRTFWLRTGIHRYFQLIRYLMMSGVAGFVLNYIICAWYLDNPPESARNFCGFYLLFFLLAVFFLVAERFAIHYLESFGFRQLYTKKLGPAVQCRRVLIYGGGLFCRIYLTYIYSGFSTLPRDTVIVGICDDNKALHGLNVYGFPVLGDLDHLEEIMQRSGFNEIMVTVRHPRQCRLDLIDEFCRARGVKCTRFICQEESTGTVLPALPGEKKD